MPQVNGIGGIFFRAKNPDELARWYQTHLGIDPVSETGAWAQDAGPTVFAPFAQDTEYFDRPEQQWMINFRVSDLDALIADLTEQGISVKRDPSWDMPGIGRFARIHDPEGNPVELWEPEQT